MSLHRIGFVVAGLLMSTAAVVGSLEHAEGSCNSLPTASEVGTGHTPFPIEVVQGDGSAVPMSSSQLGAFRYKAALGRVDGVFFTPGPREHLRFVSDGLCVGGAKRAKVPLRIKPMGPIDDLAVFVAFDAKAGLPTPIWPYAPQPSFPLSRLATAMRELPPAPGSHVPPAVDFTLSDWDERIRSFPVGNDVNGLTIPVPSLFGAVAAHATETFGRNLDSSSVRILAIRMRDKTPQALAGELSEFLTQDCGTICDDLLDAGGELCIDQIFRGIPTDGIDVYFEYAPDRMLCSVDIPQPYTDNIFAEVCDPGLLNQNAVKQMVNTPPPASVPPAGVLTSEVFDPQLEECDPNVSTLKFWRSECGGIHIPLDYSQIRTRQLFDGSNRTKVTRRLGGTSAVGRGSDLDDKRMYVPGREFVGSTPQLDSSARSPDVSWRLPALDVWYPDGQESSEFGLVGVADKDSSIVHVFPRMAATHVCMTPERGCMAVDSTGDSCACADTGVSSCTCTRLHLTGRFYACSGGDRENMPCTRDAHCMSRDTSRAGGTCSREPICRPEHTVWRRKSDGDPDPSGSVRCHYDDQCGTGEQCGYSLFDFRNRTDAAGWHYLDRDVVVPPPSPGRLRRGGCAHNRNLICTNANAPGFAGKCPETNRCRGYRLAAGPELP